ncbi:protein kinase domain-containing protein [Neorhodopirellula lusitana]|uniref:protein kinase domain-containing protein n=1 Tax=Neorhodopirellula lusitana TaxID=445327 RepID=UPI00384F5906
MKPSTERGRPGFINENGSFDFSAPVSSDLFVVDGHGTRSPRDLTLMKEIDAICLQFEENWGAGNSPPLKGFLQDWEEPARSTLLEELLLTELELSGQSGRPACAAEYVADLPNDASLIERVFGTFEDTDVVDVRQLIARLRDSGLLTSSEIDRVLQQAEISIKEIETRGSALRLKDTLLSDGGLTAFQTTVLSERQPRVPLVLGDYVIVDYIGAGGMGMVLKAKHRRMKRMVALKILPVDVSHSADRGLRFQREVEAVARLTHPNIVTAYDAGQDEGISYLIMELIEGQDLSRYVKEHGSMQITQMVDVVTQAAQGLKYAHENQIIHRDIKPANILLTNDGVVKILDMGLARLRTDTSGQGHTEPELTSSGMVVGTIDYAAPEQTSDAKAADPRSDIYSLGCTLHFLLTGNRMFNGTSLVDRLVAHRQKAAPTLPTDLIGMSTQLQDCFQKMVAKEPTKRFQDMQEVIVALQTCAPAAVSPTMPVLKTSRIRPSAAGILVATMLLVVCVGFADWMLAMGIIFRVKTPGGTIVLELEQQELDGADIIINEDKTATIRFAGDPQEVRVEAKSGTLQVSKAGFHTSTFKFQIDDKSGKALVKVRLEKLPATPDAPALLKTDVKSGVVSYESEPWTGLVLNPAKLPGIKQWQVITRDPRGVVTSLAWSPDEKFIACGATDGHVRIYDSGSFGLVRVIPGQATVSWSPNGSMIATTNYQAHRRPDDNKKLSIWNATTGKLEAAIGPFDRQIDDFQWSHDGSQLLLGLANEVLVIDSAHADVKLRIKVSGAWQTKIGWRSDESQIVVGGLGSGIGIYDSQKGLLQRSVDIPTEATDLAFSPDGHRAVLVIDKAQLRELDLNSQEFGFSIDSNIPDLRPRTIAWSRDSSAVFVTRRDSQVLRIDADSGNVEQFVSNVRPNYRNTPEYFQGGLALAVSPLTERLAAGFWDGAILTWDAERAPTAGIERSDAVHFESVSWSSDGRQCLAGTINGDAGGNWYVGIRQPQGLSWSKTDIGGWSKPIWDHRDDGVIQAVPLWKWIESRPATFLMQLRNQGLAKLTVVVPSPDGRHFVAQAENRVVLLDADGHVTGEFTTKNDFKWANFDWASDSQRVILSWLGDGRAYEWKIGDEKPQLMFGGAEGEIKAISYSPNGEWIALTERSPSLLIYRASDWSLQSKRTFREAGLLEELSWASDSAQLATVATDGTVRVHSLEGDVGSVIGRHSEYGTSVDWHPTKPLVVSVGHDETIRMSDPTTKELISTTYVSGPEKAVTLSNSGEVLWKSAPAASQSIVRIQETEEGKVEIQTVEE